LPGVPPPRSTFVDVRELPGTDEHHRRPLRFIRARKSGQLALHVIPEFDGPVPVPWNPRLVLCPAEIRPL